MKKLSEFKNEDAVLVISKLMIPIYRILGKIRNIERGDDMTPMQLVSSMLQASPSDVVEVFAILNEQPVEEYECNGAELMVNALKLASDKEFMELFGLQSQTETSSGSVSETTEGH